MRFPKTFKIAVAINSAIPIAQLFFVPIAKALDALQGPPLLPRSACFVVFCEASTYRSLKTRGPIHDKWLLPWDSPFPSLVLTVDI